MLTVLPATLMLLAQDEWQAGRDQSPVSIALSQSNHQI